MEATGSPAAEGMHGTQRLSACCCAVMHAMHALPCVMPPLILLHGRTLASAAFHHSKPSCLPWLPQVLRQPPGAPGGSSTGSRTDCCGQLLAMAPALPMQAPPTAHARISSQSDSAALRKPLIDHPTFSSSKHRSCASWRYGVWTALACTFWMCCRAPSPTRRVGMGGRQRLAGMGGQHCLASVLSHSDRGAPCHATTCHAMPSLCQVMLRCAVPCPCHAMPCPAGAVPAAQTSMP